MVTAGVLARLITVKSGEEIMFTLFSPEVIFIIRRQPFDFEVAWTNLKGNILTFFENKEFDLQDGPFNSLRSEYVFTYIKMNNLVLCI